MTAHEASHTRGSERPHDRRCHCRLHSASVAAEERRASMSARPSPHHRHGLEREIQIRFSFYQLTCHRQARPGGTKSRRPAPSLPVQTDRTRRKSTRRGDVSRSMAAVISRNGKSAHSTAAKPGLRGGSLVRTGSSGRRRGGQRRQLAHGRSASRCSGRAACGPSTGQGASRSSDGTTRSRAGTGWELPTGAAPRLLGLEEILGRPVVDAVGHDGS